MEPPTARPGRRLAFDVWRRLPVVALMGLALPAFGTGAVQAACDDLRADATAAVDAGDATVAAILAERAVVEPSCDEAFRNWLQVAAGRLLLAEAMNGLDGGEPLARQQGKLERASRLARLWPAEAMLGDIDEANRDYLNATRRFQAALQIIGDPVATEQPPDTEVIEEIFRKAERTRLLAAEYARAPRNRDGSVTGLGARSVRGFAVTKVAVPVRFEFDSVQMTPEGREAAQDLLETLLIEAPAQAITLIGHTDPKGEADYNLDLSRRRAEALKGFLEEGGYPGEIKTEGRGESAPYPIPHPERFTEAEQDQMHRRVELVR